MHHAISTKVLGQTHMWYTQHKWSNFLEIFQFLWVFEFFNTQKQNMQSKTNKNSKYKVKFVKETWHHPTEYVRPIKQVCNNEKKWGHMRDKD